MLSWLEKVKRSLWTTIWLTHKLYLQEAHVFCRQLYHRNNMCVGYETYNKKMHAPFSILWISRRRWVFKGIHFVFMYSYFTRSMFFFCYDHIIVVVVQCYMDLPIISAYKVFVWVLMMKSFIHETTLLVFHFPCLFLPVWIISGLCINVLFKCFFLPMFMLRW